MPLPPSDIVLVSNRDIVAVIDGTGPIDDEDYRKEFADSFCSQIKNRCSATGLYRRGVPGEESTKSFGSRIYSMLRSGTVSISGESSQTALGMGETVHRTGGAFDPARARPIFGAGTGFGGNPYARNPLEQQMQLVGNLKESPGLKDYRLFLVGYSRGGSECIFLAHLFKLAGLTVEAMFLFDAVNMTIDLAAYRSIPSNVKACYHAYRDPAFALPYWMQVQAARNKLKLLQQRKFALTLAQSAFDHRMVPRMPPPRQHANNAELRDLTEEIADVQAELDLAEDRLNKTRSNRWTNRLFDWGNVGLECENKARTRMLTLPFPGSHGAVGGVPWDASMFPFDVTHASAVKNWMWQHLETHRVFPELRATFPGMANIA